MTKRLFLLLFLAVAGFTAQKVSAADFYVRGGFNGDTNWTNSYLMNDAGTGDDATAGDGIYTATINVTSIGEWKASDGTTWYPTANAVTRTTGSTVFVYDSNTYNDDYLPNANFVYVKNPRPILTTDTIRIAGTFQDELTSGTADWTASDDATRMYDDGSHGGDASAGDGIYTCTITGVPAGSYQMKFTVNGSWTFSFGGGFQNTNTPLTVLAKSDHIKILLNSTTGRYKIENDNPLVNPGPPFFACSGAWDDTMSTSTTQLYDDGTHGDVTAGDGIYAREFASTAAGTTLTVQVRQGKGDSFPGSGGYPFHAYVGQRVLVQFDTNTYSDGYLPSNKIVFTDPASRLSSFSYIQATGDWENVVTTGGDWSNNDSYAQLADAGADGDVTAGDGVFARTFSGFTAGNTYNLKFIGQAAAWLPFQFGGAGEGFTYGGSNDNIAFTAAATSLTFQVDTALGRGGVGTAVPHRPATFNQAVSVVNKAHDWTMFE